jgi:PhzF family phenazine biosynthesis protein
MKRAAARPGDQAVAESTPGELLRLAAFTTDPAGGNPAGVWIGTALPPDAEMQSIAKEVGYSETAFLAPDPKSDAGGVAGRFRVRYFSPLAEVPFCGHATIASGVALAQRSLGLSSTGDRQTVILRTNGGSVPVDIDQPAGRPAVATLTSVATWVQEPPGGLVAQVLTLLDWNVGELDPALPPAIGFAGARHLIIAVRELATLARLDYPFALMRSLMTEHDLTTLQLVWREAADRFRARDPFAVGGVVEDPATGAAAAALGAYLREGGHLRPPATFEIVQGVEMGRPSLLTVRIEPDEPGIRVSGSAVPIVD